MQQNAATLLEGTSIPQPQTPHNKSMQMIIWNCMGAQSTDFRRNFQSLLNYHKPVLVALLEKHLQDHEQLKEDFNFINMAQAPATGHSGGIENSIIES